MEGDRKQNGLYSTNGESAAAAGRQFNTADESLQRKTLLGKVALIVGGSSENGRSLALGLAQRGADVAIIYFNNAHETVEEIKREIETLGQRCLALNSSSSDEQLPEELVQKVIDSFGKLDIFISYSASLSPLQYEREQEPDKPEPSLRDSIFPDLTVMKAALNQMLNS